MVSGIKNLHVITSEELKSNILSVTQTQQTLNAPYSPFLEILARMESRPKLVQHQGEKGSYRKPIPLKLLTSGLGTGCTIVRGSVNPGETLMVTCFDGYVLDDSWSRYQPSTKSEKKKFEALKRVLQAKNARHTQKQQQKKLIVKLYSIGRTSYTTPKRIMTWKEPANR